MMSNWYFNVLILYSLFYQSMLETIYMYESFFSVMLNKDKSQTHKGNEYHVLVLITN